MTAFLVLFAAGCGGRPPVQSEPESAERASAPVVSTRQVTIHVKDMT
jgi:hypothetical protein